jgi:hypothetical protein
LTIQRLSRNNLAETPGRHAGSITEAMAEMTEICIAASIGDLLQGQTAFEQNARPFQAARGDPR